MELKELTEKERRVFELRKEGKSLKEIAVIMSTTREPVRMWLAKVRRKLDLPLEFSSGNLTDLRGKRK